MATIKPQRMRPEPTPVRTRLPVNGMQLIIKFSASQWSWVSLADAEFSVAVGSGRFTRLESRPRARPPALLKHQIAKTMSTLLTPVPLPHAGGTHNRSSAGASQRTSMASSQVGTGGRRVSSATPPMKRLASPSSLSFRTNGYRLCWRAVGHRLCLPLCGDPLVNAFEAGLYHRTMVHRLSAEKVTRAG